MSALHQSEPEIDIRPERPQDAAAADRLVADAFGPGRLAKSAERLREGSRPLHGLSFLAWTQGEAIGCVRLWPIRIGDAPAALLGPFAVATPWRGRGLGQALVRHACAQAQAAGVRVILLVGDAPFFQRLSFEPVPPDRVRLPGPVDRRRVMWRALAPGAADDVSGAAVADPGGLAGATALP